MQGTAGWLPVLAVLLLAAHVRGIPLQWESIQPVGLSPDARFSHATVVIPSDAGLLFSFGGCTQEPALAGGGRAARSGIVTNDVWAYDQAAQGWEKLEPEASQFGCDLPPATTNSIPSPRAGHKWVAVRTGALTCGGYGYGDDGNTKVFSADGSGNIDCWWFTPGGSGRWDAMQVAAGPGPAPRASYSMSYHAKMGQMILFGGETDNGLALNDCWTLSEQGGAASQDAAFEFQKTWEWASCDPVDPITLKPMSRPSPRYGHESVFFHQHLYVMGGYAAEGSRVNAKQDMWMLTPGVSWEEMMPKTEKPDPRGFHAMWLSVNKMFVHGGQGPTGLGLGSVLSDTWEFDPYTREWAQKSSSASLPVMSHLSINPLPESVTAISFGGRDLYGRQSSRLYSFVGVEAESWKRVYPAGIRPTRRTGNTLAYDQDFGRIVSSFGMDGTGMLEDTWILDLPTSTWTCFYGSGPTCTHAAPNQLYAGPGKIAFPAQVQLGLFSFLFGGAELKVQSCADLGRGTAGNLQIPSNVLGMWAMDTGTLQFVPVVLDTAAVPSASALSSMVSASEFGSVEQNNYFSKPLVLAGGADMECVSKSPPCTIPTPSNEIWIMDIERKAAAGTNDNMIDLDGVDDVVQIVLPAWCQDVKMMSVLWIDSWFFVQSKGRIKSILFDAYSGAVPRLRWYLEGTNHGNYIKLVLSPGKGETIVKTWGPLDSGFLGKWHHVTFTLRMARQYSRSSTDPAVIITQAFCFLDGQSVPEPSGGFLTHNLAVDLVFESGLSELYVGGTSPDLDDPDYRNLKASMDNLRVWWPSCPDANDPTKCNPYGFLYPQMIDGFRSPSTGIRDDEVSLSHVAPVIQNNMFQVAASDEPGLLVQLTFDNGITEGVVRTTSTWNGPDVCPDTGYPVCDGCIPECIFSNCGIFDTDCVEAGASDPATQAKYAESGTCQCLNVNDCPRQVEGCQCPQDKGLHKVCTKCAVGVCKASEKQLVRPSPPPPPCTTTDYNSWDWPPPQVDLTQNDVCDQCDPDISPYCTCPIGSDVKNGVDMCAAVTKCRNGKFCKDGLQGHANIINSTSFADSEGMTCDDYQRNKCWCNEAHKYNVTIDGIAAHAGQVCCACTEQGGGIEEDCDSCDSYNDWGERNGLARNGVCEDLASSNYDRGDWWDYIEPEYGWWYIGGCEPGTDSFDCDSGNRRRKSMRSEDHVLLNSMPRASGPRVEGPATMFSKEELAAMKLNATLRASRSRLEYTVKTLSQEELAAHRSPHEWEEFSLGEWNQYRTTNRISGRPGEEQSSDERYARKYYHHRATGLTQWEKPKGWDKQKAEAHQKIIRSTSTQQQSSSASARRLLATTPGEGDLCHVGGAQASSYPQSGPDLPATCDVDPRQRVPCSASPDPRPLSSDGETRMMMCQPLDPMFCPDSSFCTEWDCMCYGPGNKPKTPSESGNVDTSLEGLLGKAVYDRAKSSGYCGCPYDDGNSWSLSDGTQMVETSMPFVNKADVNDNLVDAYQCCDDWFDGIQCTKWEYNINASTGALQAASCVEVYSSDSLRQCAASSCCSAYTEDYGGGKQEGSDSCMWSNDGWCDEPMWCDPGTDFSDCSAERGDDYNFECDDCGSGGGSGGSDGGEGLGEHQCQVTVDYTDYIATFEYDYGQYGTRATLTPVEASSQLLDKDGHSRSSDSVSIRASGKKPASARPSGQITLIGAEVPFASSPDASSAAPSRSATLKPSKMPGASLLLSTRDSAASLPSSESGSPIKERLQPGASSYARPPGGPGGKKSRRQAQRLEAQNAMQQDADTHNDRVVHNRRLLQNDASSNASCNSTGNSSCNSSNSSSVSSSEDTSDTATVDLGVVYGQLAINVVWEESYGYFYFMENWDDYQCPPTYEDVYEYIQKWIAGILKTNATLAGYDTDVITVETTDEACSSLTADQKKAKIIGFCSEDDGECPGAAGPLDTPNNFSIVVTVANATHRGAIVRGLRDKVATRTWCKDDDDLCPPVCAEGDADDSDWTDGYGYGYNCDDVGNYDYCGEEDTCNYCCQTCAGHYNCGDSMGSTGDFSVFPASDMSESELPQWLEGPEALFCGDSKASPENPIQNGPVTGEVCDLGAEKSNSYTACSTTCACANGFTAASGECVCNADHPDTTITAVEGNVVQGEENAVTFALQFTKSVTGLSVSGMLQAPVVVTISGLQGVTGRKCRLENGTETCDSVEEGEVTITCKGNSVQQESYAKAKKWPAFGGGITTVSVSGTGTGYTSGALLVNCSGACTGSGLSGYCDNSTAGAVKVTITNPGSGYHPSGLPTVACPGGSGHTFTIQPENVDCQIGLAPAQEPASGSAPAWRKGSAEFSKAAGTLKFTVLGGLPGTQGEPGWDPKDNRFRFATTFTNPDHTLNVRRPEVSVCGGRAAGAASSHDVSIGLYQNMLADGEITEKVSKFGYILGSQAKRLIASSVDQVVEFKKSVENSEQTVLKVTVPGGSLSNDAELLVHCLETFLGQQREQQLLVGEINTVHLGLSKAMNHSLPYKYNGNVNNVVAGAGNTMVDIEVRNRNTKSSTSLLSDGIEVELLVDEQVLRTRGGCYTPESNTVTVCLPGFLGLYAFETTGERSTWSFIPDEVSGSGVSSPEYASRKYRNLHSKVSSSTAYAALALSACNDYEGSGRAGGDRICVDPSLSREELAFAVLGAGSLSKMPAVTGTSRPDLNDQAALTSYLDPQSSEMSSYLPSKSWQKIDNQRFEADTVLPERFGHAMAVVSGKRVLIYGGTGCARYDDTSNTSTGYCVEASRLNDLWEFDLLKWAGSGNPLSLMALSPVLHGLSGVSMISLPGQDHRVLSFGGAGADYALTEMLNTQQNQSDAKFEYRELYFRASKAVNSSIQNKDSISSASVASNSTHVMIFAGYLGNSRTAALHTYTLAASSPGLGLELMFVPASGPNARSFPGVIKPDDTTLLMYGGVVKRESDGIVTKEASGELWRFDLNAQSWYKVHATLASNKPRAYGAFGSVVAGADTILFVYGGLRDSFVSGRTFEPSTFDDDSMHQVSDDGHLYATSQASPQKSRMEREAWLEFRPSSATSKPEKRAFQTFNPGTFIAGKMSMMLFGGLNRQGKALGDLWYLDAEDQTEGKSYQVILGNITKEEYDGTLTADGTRVIQDEIDKQVKLGWGMPEGANCDANSKIEIKRTENGPEGTKSLVITFTVEEEITFQNCMEPVMSSAGDLEAALSNTPAAHVTLSTSDQDLDGVVTELKMPWFAYRSNEWCKPGDSYRCSRALCQSTAVDGVAEYDLIRSRPAYCYDDWNADGVNDYQYSWPRETNKFGQVLREAGPCGADYYCAAPGPRHGHASDTMLVQGDSYMLAVVAGETKDWAENEQSLTMSVNIASFSSTFVTWAQARTVDIDGQECAADSGDGVMCPQPRRDTSVKIMGNDGTSNGRLIMFGGLAAGPLMQQSTGRAYLEGTRNVDLVPLYDLWYLDMRPLTVNCAAGTEACAPLTWTLVDVPGMRPVGRWGAGLVVDPADNLYVIGGSTFDVTAQEYKVLSDIFIFQLRDPFFKYCSATGAGLYNAVAGVSTPFYIQCRDIFGEPANSASFQVDITGKEGQPGMKPAPFSVGNGLYKCSYTPFQTGQYEIRIYVGRGGEDYKDLIEGVDLEPKNDVHDYTFAPARKGQPSTAAANIFTVVVAPSATNADKSISAGDSITENTAGIIGTFLITATDVFSNRRPGGDTVTSIMTLWNTVNGSAMDESQLPETGSVLDNMDGSFAVTYRITKAGTYQHAVALANSVGAGTPVMLAVRSDVADVSRTYVYGELLTLETGRASTVYVQTRDQWGNNIRYTNEERPCMGYPLWDTCDQIIEYQLCKSDGVVLQADSFVCPEDQIEASVGKSLQYQVGPTGLTTDAQGFPYYGLYELTIFPFVADSFMPMVFHNGTYVKCYFDSAGAIGTADADPGWQLADACVAINNAQQSGGGAQAARRNGVWHSPSQPMGVVQVQDHAMLTKIYQDAKSPFGMDTSDRRNVESNSIQWADTKLEVSRQFVDRDTAELESWLTAAPILCAVIGLGMSVLHALYDFYEHRRDTRVHALIAEMEDGFKKETEDDESLNVVQEIRESNGTAGTGNATKEAWAAQDPTPAAAVHETDTTRVSENELAAFEADVDRTGIGQVMQEDTTQIEETTVVAGAAHSEAANETSPATGQPEFVLPEALSPEPPALPAE